jgi:hypothetical protein
MPLGGMTDRPSTLSHGLPPEAPEHETGLAESPASAKLLRLLRILYSIA